MTPTELQMQLAEALGWSEYVDEHGIALGWVDANKTAHMELPDWPHDLNAVVEAIPKEWDVILSRWGGPTVGWRGLITVWFDNADHDYQAYADTPALALATALLAAMRTRKEMSPRLPPGPPNPPRTGREDREVA